VTGAGLPNLLEQLSRVRTEVLNIQTKVCREFIYRIYISFEYVRSYKLIDTLSNPNPFLEPTSIEQ
jgi:hypothetical protein